MESGSTAFDAIKPLSKRFKRMIVRTASTPIKRDILKRQDHIMKIGTAIARVLLGLMFVVFGLNGFLRFIPQPPPPAGPASEYMGALAATHYFVPVFALQFIGGLLLLTNQFVPLGLTLLGPIVVNILLYHGLMEPKGIAPGIVVAVLWLVVAHSVRSAFMGIFQQRVSPEPSGGAITG